MEVYDKNLRRTDRFSTLDDHIGKSKIITAKGNVIKLQEFLHIRNQWYGDGQKIVFIQVNNEFFYVMNKILILD